MTDETQKPVKTETQIEMEKQTDLLDAINAKLNLFSFVLILYILGAIYTFFFGI